MAVLLDSTRTRELYRVGPYNQSTVDIALFRIMPEIKRVGLEDFVSERQTENATHGPVSVALKSAGFSSWPVPHLHSFKAAITRWIQPHS